MDKVVVNSYEDFEKLLGRQIGISDYVEVSQDRINLFADATLDHQWIHVDTERAKVESPYHSTIVHGYLTLSLLPHMWNQIIEVNNLKTVSYTHLRAHETGRNLVCRLLLEKKKKNTGSVGKGTTAERVRRCQWSVGKA